jgi:hypothetical protein
MVHVVHREAFRCGNSMDSCSFVGDTDIVEVMVESDLSGLGHPAGLKGGRFRLLVGRCPGSWWGGLAVRPGYKMFAGQGLG